MPLPGRGRWRRPSATTSAMSSAAPAAAAAEPALVLVAAGHRRPRPAAAALTEQILACSTFSQYGPVWCPGAAPGGSISRGVVRDLHAIAKAPPRRSRRVGPALADGPGPAAALAAASALAAAAIGAATPSGLADELFFKAAIGRGTAAVAAVPSYPAAAARSASPGKAPSRGCRHMVGAVAAGPPGEASPLAPAIAASPTSTCGRRAARMALCAWGIGSRCSPRSVHALHPARRSGRPGPRGLPAGPRPGLGRSDLGRRRPAAVVLDLIATPRGAYVVGGIGADGGLVVAFAAAAAGMPCRATTAAPSAPRRCPRSSSGDAGAAIGVFDARRPGSELGRRSCRRGRPLASIHWSSLRRVLSCSDYKITSASTRHDQLEKPRGQTRSRAPAQPLWRYV